MMNMCHWAANKALQKFQTAPNKILISGLSGADPSKISSLWIAKSRAKQKLFSQDFPEPIRAVKALGLKIDPAQNLS